MAKKQTLAELEEFEPELERIMKDIDELEENADKKRKDARSGAIEAKLAELRELLGLSDYAVSRRELELLVDAIQEDVAHDVAHLYRQILKKGPRRQKRGHL